MNWLLEGFDRLREGSKNSAVGNRNEKSLTDAATSSRDKVTTITKRMIP